MKTKSYFPAKVHGQGEWVGFGYDRKFLMQNNGGALKGWETNEIAWVWEKRRYGEMRSEE